MALDGWAQSLEQQRQLQMLPAGQVAVVAPRSPALPLAEGQERKDQSSQTRWRAAGTALEAAAGIGAAVRSLQRQMDLQMWGRNPLVAALADHGVALAALQRLYFQRQAGGLGWEGPGCRRLQMTWLHRNTL